MKRTLWTVLLITGCTGRSDLLEQLGFYPERCGGPCADDAEMVLRQEDGQVFVDFDAELWTFPQILQWEVSESADPNDLGSTCEVEDWTITYEGGWYEAENYPVAHGAWFEPRKRWQDQWVPGIGEEAVLEPGRVYRVSAPLVDRTGLMVQANQRAVFVLTEEGLVWENVADLCFR